MKLKKRKAQHSPGPWIVRLTPKLGELWIANRTAKMTIANSIHGATASEAEANARLIAAAPDLLEALEGLLNPEGEEDFSTENYGETIPAYKWEKARAAIAKAKGNK